MKKKKSKILRILTINSGSSSLKFSLYHLNKKEELQRAGELERIGISSGHFFVKDKSETTLLNKSLELPDHDSALKELFHWLNDDSPDKSLDAVAHRIVHGGSRLREPLVINKKIIEQLGKLIPLAPDHLPHELKAIKSISKRFPKLKQTACFDTSFHKNISKTAQLFGLPNSYYDQGIMRYGFHGLSYEYIMSELKKETGKKEYNGKIIIAHLGNGASMAAVNKQKCIDTTMSFTPSGGMVMGTRSGDLDPGVLLYLIEEKKLKPSTVKDIVNNESGLLGVSGITSNMKDLIQKRKENKKAEEAIDLFCYTAKKYLGSLISILGGLDTLIFTGGIGENSSYIRKNICNQLDFLQLKLDHKLNNKNEKIISTKSSKVNVRVIKTNEELMLARHSERLIKE